MAKKFRGIVANQEFKSYDAVRDLRPFWMQVRDLIKSRWGAIFFLILLAGLMYLTPSFTDLYFLLGIFIFWFSCFTFIELPYKLPAYSGLLDRNDPKSGTTLAGTAAGIYFFGNDIASDEQLWFSNNDMRTHALIFGSTGSGKTEALLSISFNALAQGSGFIYVDGKGDNALFAKIFAMTRSMGREDDLLLVNFMTGAADIIGPQETVLSNTMNPFAAGSSSMLSQLVVSMMDSGGGGSGDGDMWKGRAISFIEALMRPLVWMRDHGYMLLEAGLIRKYFTLDVLEEMLYDRKVIDQNNNITIMPEILPFEVRDSLENYLATLPGYQKSEKGKQSGKAYEQHGYITMQLTRIFGSLADVYGHIVRTNLAEVDFHDVVLNRRILVVLLPALEKSTEELSNLGKLIIASLKAMLASGLGSAVEGDYKDVIERKPTNSKTPFLCVLDEYGYYAVKGFAVVPAQARSLGFSVIFAGQDLPAFQKGGKEEAASICANTNIKICMKLEDPVETWDFFQKTAGESYVSVAKNFSRQGGGSSSLQYKDTMEASLDKRNRIDLLDLKDQREGEGHIFFKSKIVRARMFYANPPKVGRVKLNQFLKVKGPSDQSVSLIKSLQQVNNTISDYKANPLGNTLKDLFDLFKKESFSTDKKGLSSAIQAFIQGKKEEDAISFGDQSTNPSIFMFIKVEERLGSRFFDIETSTLLPSILTKEKLFEVVKRLNILLGKSESLAKGESYNIIQEIEGQTSYADCLPIRSEGLATKFRQYVTNGT